jgi:hypothetical protein
VTAGGVTYYEDPFGFAFDIVARWPWSRRSRPCFNAARPGPQRLAGRDAQRTPSGAVAAHRAMATSTVVIPPTWFNKRLEVTQEVVEEIGRSEMSLDKGKLLREEAADFAGRLYCNQKTGDAH